MDDHPEPRDLDDALDRLHDDIVDLIRRIIDEYHLGQVVMEAPKDAE
jgi:hypothetical protein